jgi:predicted nucleotidyltransferase
MELTVTGKKIIFNRELSNLDYFVIDFIKLLEKHHVNYVIVSGYIAIVFGRSRNTEDVDIIVEKPSQTTFNVLWKDIIKRYECVNTSDPNEAYMEYLSQGCGIRFSQKGTIIPNIEFKCVHGDDDDISITQARLLVLNSNPLRISPLEMQIAYKMYLGSDKDFEDAKFLFDLLNEHLDKAKLNSFLAAFNTKTPLVRKYLKGLQ